MQDKGAFKGMVLAFALIAYVGAVGALANFLVPELSPAAPQALSSSPRPAVAAFSFPLDYAVSVRDCLPSGRECSQTRYYAAKETK